MSFDIKYLSKTSAGMGRGASTWAYDPPTDAQAAILAAAYFNDAIAAFTVDDLIYITCTDGDFWVKVSSVTTNVSVVMFAGVRIDTVTVTTAQLLALRATPATLVAAPGAGLYLEFLGASLILDYNSIAYTESTDNMAIRFTNTTAAIVSQAIESTGFIDQTVDTITSALPKIDAIVAASVAVNAPLVLHNTGDGEFASGNSPLIVKIAYRVHSSGL